LLHPIANLPRILVVAREPLPLRPLWTIGEANNWHLETALGGWQALERLQSGAGPDLVFLDLTPGDPDGMYAMRWLRRIRPDLPIVVLSHNGDAEQEQEAMRSGAQEYLVWPIDQQGLEMVIRRCISSTTERMDAEIGAEEIERIGEDMFFVAAGPNMRKLRAQAELLAKVNSPVLIAGESGSGREQIARLIHQLSVRSGFRFLKVNCAALPGDMLERELFGNGHHVTAGNGRAAPGKFELCHQGTLFLDDITEMPMSLQAKLLRVLQDGHVSLHGEHPVDMDCRIMASANVYPEQVEPDKKLREDLYYRLSAFTLHVPPLRQRGDDIPLLLGHFMNQLSRHYNLPVRVIPLGVLEACQSYSWPGNLRELQNFVKCYLMTGDEELVLGELERNSRTNSETVCVPQKLGSVSDAGGESDELKDPSSGLKSLVQNAKGTTERHAIADALWQTHWNRKAAARLLQVSYRTLLYKIEQYRMSPSADHFPQYWNGGGFKGSRQGS
jgi:two-component system, NtrC family, response regulator AtoC